MQDGEAMVDRCRRAARQLQQDLGSPDPAVARAAAVRFVQLPQHQHLDLAEVIAGEKKLRRAEAQAVVAFEHGFLSWGELLRTSLPLVACVTMHCSGMAAFLNQWFASYDEAAAARQRSGGYLLPYRTQFFVAEAAAVRELGLDPDDPDWQRIGFDWVRPRDAEAHHRLCRARLDVMLARGEDLAET